MGFVDQDSGDQSWGRKENIKNETKFLLLIEEFDMKVSEATKF